MKILLLAIVSLLSLSAVAKETKSGIISIKGRLYYHTKGEWSKNIFDKDFHIWNSTIGSGSLEGPADRTLFEIEVNGNDLQKVVIKVEHILDGKTKTVLETKKTFSSRKRGESMKIPVLVEDTTNGTYVVTASIEDMAEIVGKPKVAKVEFNQGSL